MAAHAFPCRFCKAPVTRSIVDLGMSPLCESFVAAEVAGKMEPFYPLHAFICENCFLAQVDEFVPADDIFTEYAYFSSFSDSWVEHARRYCVDITDRLSLDDRSMVVEVASNDGYLLQHFVDMGIKCYGIEPAANVAKVAVEKGIPTEVVFFGRKTAQRLKDEGRGADLVCGANVLAQVPNLNDFIQGLKVIMNPGATMTIEFPHLMATIEGNQFDQIYHEHYCYFSLLSSKRVFAAHGISIFDIEELSTHGGSLRVYGRHSEEMPQETERLLEFERREAAFGVDKLELYASFAEKVERTKWSALEFLLRARREGKTVAAYGAPGKGNTFLNFCGIKPDLISYTVDRNPYKHGRFLPGSRIPIFPPEHIAKTKPEVIVILPWNLSEEIAAQLSYTSEWGAKIVRLVPCVETISSGVVGQLNAADASL